MGEEKGDADKPRKPDSPRVAFTAEMPPPEIKLGDLAEPASREKSLLAFTAFVNENWDVYTWDFVEGHEPVQLTHTLYDEAGPSLAADHSYCVYESVDGKVWRVSLGPDAKPETLPFGSDQKFDMHPGVSSDGKGIVLATSLDRTTDDSDLIVYYPGPKDFGPRLELLAYQHYPAWAPDSRHIAFGNLHGRLWTGGPVSEIWVMRTDAPWARQLTMLDSLSISPSWSPRGDRIAFASNRGGHFNLWMVNPHTREYARLTEGEAADTDPTFSPDGESLIFVSTRDGRLGLWKLDLNSMKATPVRPFGQDSNTRCKDPDWK